ncbi:MAG: radical SAM protein [Planctomycetota bacterium]|nr:MAG: radical SAM protein [Planctomycetota bacterium]
MYGPVPSRRLSQSLGIDIVPFKVCTLDCIYCQLGRTSEKTVERKEYAPINDVLAELKDRLETGLHPDFITISGSGEPTLHSRLADLITGIKNITDIPVAVITNGTLLFRQDVRADCAKADVVLPSLDAPDQQTFQRINRPHKDISIENVISGLAAFRNEFAGQIWLELFLIAGVNTNPGQIAKFKDVVKHIRPDKIHLNTAVRPTAEPGLQKLNQEKLRDIAKQLGKNCEVVADFSPRPCGKHNETKPEYLLSMLKRRPCSLNDICEALAISTGDALKSITQLQLRGLISSTEKDGLTFYHANPR